MKNKRDPILSALAVLEKETRALIELKSSINADFVKACSLLLDCKGRIVVTGMGKSGHIGHKVAATLASTGSPAFFVHPGEASHGDLGMITPEDAVIAISNSGETEEIITILPMLKRLNIPLITFTGNLKSTLAQIANVNIYCGVSEEACPLGLAPTSSTTAALVMGDALAIALLESRGFTREDFARSHPGGKLGRRLLLTVADLMHSGSALPQVSQTASIKSVLLEMSDKGLGMAGIVDEQGGIIGVFTDGDLRRTLDHAVQNLDSPVSEIMRKGCITIAPKTLAAEALQLMESKKINGLLVVDENNKLIGALNMHDLLRARVV